MNPIFDKNLIRKYVQDLRDSGVRSSIVALKLKSIKKYIIWSTDEKIIDTESFRNLSYFLDQEILGLHESFQERLQYKLKSLMPQRKQKTTPKATEPTLKNKAYTPQVLVGYALLVILISFLGAGIYNQFFIKASTPFAFPNTLTRGTRIISFQGRLTDSLGNPIVAQTDVVFKLYNVSSGGSPLYTGSCTGGSGLTPDQDGIFNALVGQDCSMSEIPSSVFTENANVYLGVTVGSDAEMTPRQQIANVGYALNAETLQGLPPGQTPASIPYINNQGDVLMAAATAGIRSTYASATFNISSANAVTVASAGSGDVTLNASQSGTIKLQTANTDRITIVNGGNIGIGNVTNPSSFNVQIAGTVGPNATDTYDLGSISKEWRNIYGQALFQNGAAVCDALGTNCSIAGGWTDDGQVVRLTTSTDKVGIGTTNAIGKLHVTGAITGKALAVFDETGDQALFTASASGISKFIIDHAGNVGIGTTSSAASLYVSRSDGNPLMRLERTSQPGYWDFYVSNGAFNNRDLRIKPNNDTSSITFENAAGTSGVLHMRPDTIRVGINDTSPDFRLESVGSSGQGYFGVTNSVDGDIFTINANGNVGIGATNPLEKLDLQGNASVSGNLVLAGSSRAIQSTAFNSLTLGGSTTGSILLNPNNGATGGLVAPVNTNVTDLGSSSQQFRNFFAQNIKVNGVNVCDANGNNCPSLAAAGGWTDGGTNVYLTTSTDQVGIGTNSPTSKLHVSGAITGKALAILDETGDQALFTASASGVAKFIIDHSGRVGIATTDFTTYPSQFVVSSGGNQPAWITSSSTAESAVIYENTSSSKAYELIVGGSSPTKGVPTGGFGIRDRTIGTVRLTVATDGNVGIGTTSPTSVLHILPSSTVTGAILTARGTTSSTAGGIDLSPTIASNATSYGIYSEPIFSPTGNISSANGYLALVRAQNSSSNITTMRGFYAGNRTSANYSGTLTNAQGVFIETPIYSGSTPANQYGIYIDNQTGGSSTNYSIYSAGGTMYHAGNVGIGTTNPTSKLDVNGSVNVSGYATASASLAVGYTSVTAGVGNGVLSGNVGIGTSNPQNRIAIEGAGGGFINIQRSDSLNANGGLRFTGSDSVKDAEIAYNNAIGSAMTFYSNSAYRMTIASSGNVGIGTTGPTELLDVAGNASVSGNLVLAGGSRAIQSTAFNSLTLGGSTTGSILLNPNNGATGGLVAPVTTNVTDLGSSSQQFRNIYGQNIYVNGNAVCDSAGNNCPSSSGAWTLSSPYLYPTASINRIGIGTTTTSQMVSQLYVTRTLSDGALGKALAIFNQTENQDIFTASASGATKFVINSNGNVGIGSTAPGGGLEIDVNTASKIGQVIKTLDNSTTKNLTEWQSSTASVLGKVDASGNFYTAAGGASGTGTNLLTTTNYVQSRGMNLVTNGSGLLGNNYNFSNFTFDQVYTYGGIGSFKNSNFNTAVFTDELIPVDGSRYYKLSLWANSTVHATGAHAYFGVSTYDIDGNYINPQFYYKFSGSTDTTLAAQLNPGDTTVTLTDATGWNNAGAGHQRNFAWYGYTNSFGYTYPDYTYSRNNSSNYSDFGSNGAWNTSGISGNVITLRSAWSGPTVLAGTAVRNSQSGSSYNYIAASNVDVPNTWTNYSGYIGGWDTTGSGSSNKFPYGTASVKLLFLLNRDVAGNTTNVSNIWFSELTDASASTPGIITLGNQTFGTGDKSFSGNVGIGVTNPVHKLELVAGTTAAGGIGFGTDTELYRSAANTLALASGDSLNLVSGALQVGGTTVITSGSLIQAANGSSAAPSLSFSGDSNTGIYGTGSDVLRFATGATDRMTIDATGNVGIGTTAPGVKLDVYGDIKAEDVSGRNIGFANTGGGNVFYRGMLSTSLTSGLALRIRNSASGNTDPYIIFGSSAGGVTDALTVNVSSGNVGIGTTTALEKLDVQGNASVSGNFALAGSSRSIQSTANNTLTIGGNTTGDIVVKPQNTTAGGGIIPGATNVTDLGRSGLQYRNIYGQALYVNGVAVCDSAGNNCPTGSSAWTLASPNLYPQQSLYRVGIGTTTTSAMISQLYVTRTISDGALGKALAIFNHTENQDLITASASGTPRFTVTNAGNLQFHQASSITTTTGNLTLDSTGGTTTISDNAVVTGTSDLQGSVANSTGNIVLADTTDIGSGTTGIRVDTQGNITDIDGNIVLNDITDIGSATTGINITAAGAISDTDGNVVINDTTDIGSSSTGINVTTAGALSDIDGNLVLNDQTDIGSATTGLRVTTAGGLSDIDGNLAIADTTDITGGLTVSQYATVSATLNVGYATAKPGPGNGVFSGNVGIGTSNPTHQLELGAGTTAAQGINFGTDVDFYRSAADTLALGTGDSFNIVSGNLQFGGTTVLNSSRQLSNIAGVTTSLTPTAANTYALGTATTNQYSTIYGQSIFVNGSAVCDAAGNNCPTGLYVNLQAATPGSQQTGNLNISGAALVGYLADTSNSNYGIDPAGTSNFGGFSLKVTGASLLALDSGNVGIGTGTPVGKLHVDATAVGKALAIFNDNGTNQALLTASASGVTKFIVDHNGNVGIGIISPTHALEFAASTAASGGINFGTDVDLYRGATNRLDLGTGDDLNLVSGNIQIAATTIINSSRQLNNIAGVTTSLTPTAANTYALGTATTNQYSTIYGQSIFVNGSAVCDAAGNNCPAGASSWTLTGNALYPTASTSRIGIGSTTTANMVSQFYLTRTLTDGSLGKALAIFDQSENQPIIAASASGSTKFIIDYTGNVGIGTTTPAGKLTISQASTTSSDGLYITDASANTGRLYVGSSGSFRLQAGSNNTQLVLHSAGNVGIGTTNPLAQFSVGSTSQFQVNSTGNLTAINGVTYSWPGSQGGASTVLTNNGSGTLTWASVGTLTGTGANGQVAFWNGTTTQAGTNSFFWDNTNNLLGIGLNTPVAKLHLDGEVKGKALAIFNETGDQDVFVASASGSNVFAIKHNGNVGIGTTAPGAKLEIGGTTSTISNTAGNINITPTADLVVTSGNLGIGASPVAGGKLYLDTTNANTGNTVTMNIGNIASTTQNNWTTLNMQNGGTGFFDLELVRGIVNQQGINYFNDDFLGKAINTTNTWTNSQGTASTCSIPNGVVGGVYRMVTSSSTAGQGCSLNTQATIGNSYYKQDNNPIYEASVKMGSTANTQRAYFGFTGALPTGDANTGARHAWIGKRAADTTWQCVTGNGTTETFTSTGVAISTSAFQRLRVQLSNGSTPEVVCTVDNTSVAVTATLPGTGQVLDVFARTESTGTAATHDLDYLRAWSDDPPGGASSAAPVVQKTTGDMVERADVAENYPTAPGVTLEPGDVVRIQDGRMNKSSIEHDMKVMGIISTNPGLELGTDGYMNIAKVALNGRVPTKVSTKNGPIHEGDYLTTSTIPGVAVKATTAGIVIGKALENYEASDTNNIGKILVFTNLTWYDPQVAINSDGTLVLSQNQNALLPQPDYNSQVTVTRAANTTVTNSNGDVLSATTGYAKIVAGTILTGLTDTQNAIVSNILSAKTIIATSITSASGSFTSFTSTSFTALDGTIQKLTVSQKITSPIVETDNLKVTNTAQINNVETNTIKPQADNVTVDLSKPTNQGALANVIIKGMEGKTVTTLDAAGNATFSGTISSNKVETNDASVSGQLAAGSLNTNEASVSGTLTAKEIKADNIDALANNLGLTQNSIASQSSNLQQLSSNVNDIQKILTDLKNQSLPDPAYYQNMNQPVQIATQASALNLEKLTVSDNANMYDVSIAHNLSVGSMIITDGSILSLSWELKLSSLSTINLFDGGVIIAKDGTITTQGSVIAKGGIKTNEIEAITPKDNVNIKLASNDVIGQTDVHNTKLAVQNNQGLEVASIDASGSAQFKDLSLDKYLDATNSAAVIPAATNFTSNGIYAPALQTDRKTIGVGRMPASQSEIIIYNEKVNEGSLIYVTPTSALQNKNLFIADKHTCAEGDTACKPYFKVSISGGPTATDVTFNWWIVN